MAKPGKLWNRYAVEWTVRVPSLGIDAKLTTRLPQQELANKHSRYWEGTVEIGGAHHGSGYVETPFAESDPRAVFGNRHCSRRPSCRTSPVPSSALGRESFD